MKPNSSLFIAFFAALLPACRTLNEPNVASTKSLSTTRVHETYAKMKQFRGYSDIQAVHPFSHHFSINFEDESGPKTIFVRLKENAPIPDLKNDGESVSISNRSSGNTFAESKAPSTLAGVESQLKARALSDYPNARKMRMRYDGELRFATVRELIPISPEQTPAEKRQFWVTTQTFQMKKGTSTFERSTLFQSGQTMVRQLCNPAGIEENAPDEVYPCFKEPLFIDPKYRQQAFGTGPLAYNFIYERPGKVGPIDYLTESSKTLREELIHSVKAIDEGRYSNPITSVFNPANEVDFKNLKLNFALSVSCMLTKPDSDESIEDFANIQILHTDLTNGATYKGILPISGIEVQANISKSEFKVTLKKKNSSSEYSVKARPSSKVNWTSQNGHWFPSDGKMSYDLDPEEGEYSIPRDSLFQSYGCTLTETHSGYFVGSGLVSGIVSSN
jgi:hypothetical protein